LQTPKHSGQCAILTSIKKQCVLAAIQYKLLTNLPNQRRRWTASVSYRKAAWLQVLVQWPALYVQVQLLVLLNFHIMKNQLIIAHYF